MTSYTLPVKLLNPQSTHYLCTMPVFKQWEIGDSGSAIIWKVEEPEDFFTSQVAQASGYQLSSAIANEKRRIEHLAGRFLLQYMQPGFPLHLIQNDEHGKPRLTDGSCYFSISHSWPYVAVVLDTDKEAGIDLQTWHQRIEQIQHKFLGDDEQEMIGPEPELLTLAWCAKEAAYKWHGKKGVEFIEELPIVDFQKWGDKNMNIYFKLSKVPQMVFLESLITADFACSYIVHAQDWVIY